MSMTDNNTTGGASAATAKDTTAKDTTVKQTIPYAKSGEVFANWFNRRVSERGNVTVPLGTKTATINRLLPDGRLACEVPDNDGLGYEVQYVDFDATMVDLLLPKLATI
jgi:hypothetical protein